MLGSYSHDPESLAADLHSQGLELGALCLVCDWLGAEETALEKNEAERAITMLTRHFPGTLLVLCQMPQNNRDNLQQRQQNCLACCNAIGRRAANRGVQTVFHPNSPPGSVFRTADDYKVMIDGIDTECVGYAPDAGHIAKGGMNPVAIFKDYIPVIRHVHFKDMNDNGIWAEMGQGTIDFTSIVQVLQQANYSGWIMVEEESARAESDPDFVTRANGQYLHEKRFF